MKKSLCSVSMGCLLALAACGEGKTYEAKWSSLDQRPVPQWWVDAKFGIFVCWGLYSVPAYAPTSEAKRHAGYAEWYQGRLLTNHKDFVPFNEKHYGKMPYANHVKSFTCEHFNADEWAALFKRSGAKYTILTSKYHDGYALWPSAETPYYNSVALGPGRDLCAEFTTAMKKAGIKSGFYYSLLEFANPLYPKALPAVRGANPMPIRAWSAQMNLPQMKDLVTRCLLAIGKWLEVNGEAIYASRRGTLRGGKRVYTTDGKTARYVIDFNLDGKPFTVGGIKGPVKVELVGSSVPVEFRCEGDKLTIKPPALAPAAAPCESAWTYRVTAILNDRS